MSCMKNVLHKYKHALPLIIFGVIYVSWFCHLESIRPANMRMIYLSIDDRIPFCELFIIPYFLWFVYVAAVVCFLFFKDKDNYYKACAFLFTGMTVFLVVSTLFPNGHHLRPNVMPRDNIFTHMVSFLYRTDTPTNLWPSIHVYNSLGAHFAVMNNEALSSRRWIRNGSLVLCISIVLSTVFLKQHSMFDMITAFLLAVPMYVMVYRRTALTAGSHARKTRPKVL